MGEREGTVKPSLYVVTCMSVTRTENCPFISSLRDALRACRKAVSSGMDQAQQYKGSVAIMVP